MNLFDYIKYQGTDLSNAAELCQLPPRLIDLYFIRYQEINNIRVRFSADFDNHRTRCEHLSLHAIFPEYKTKITFNEALKEYYNESL